MNEVKDKLIRNEVENLKKGNRNITDVFGKPFVRNAVAQILLRLIGQQPTRNPPLPPST